MLFDIYPISLLQSFRIEVCIESLGSVTIFITLYYQSYFYLRFVGTLIDTEIIYGYITSLLLLIGEFFATCDVATHIPRDL